ncbi:hypothetical protein Dimus_039356 [Dionaea muscipula]
MGVWCEVCRVVAVAVVVLPVELPPCMGVVCVVYGGGSRRWLLLWWFTVVGCRGVLYVCMSCACVNVDEDEKGYGNGCRVPVYVYVKEDSGFMYLACCVV